MWRQLPTKHLGEGTGLASGPLLTWRWATLCDRYLLGERTASEMAIVNVPNDPHGSFLAPLYAGGGSARGR